MNNKRAFKLIGIFWIVIVGLFILQKEYTLRSGEEILLKTRPVDPRDLFRGDYVILSYDISQFASKLVMNEYNNLKVGDRVYVVLNTSEKFATISHVSTKLPSAELYIQGKVINMRNQQVFVEYGIESYFVPEGQGKPIEYARNSGDVSVKVAVDRKGRAMVKKLLINGEGVRFE